MSDNDLKVHGSIFYLLRKFVVNNYSLVTWEEILKQASLEGAVYDMTLAYPLAQINLIVNSASVLANIPSFKLMELFGEFMVPDLFVLYHNYLNPKWKTFDVLENTERVMHGAVRHLNSTATPPVLNVTKVNNHFLIIDYYSKRKMGSLAMGIIRGIAKFYNESESIEIISVSDPADERVQIKVEYWAQT